MITMTKSRKTGRELEPSYIEKGTPFARKLFRKIGITPAHDPELEDSETEASR